MNSSWVISLAKKNSPPKNGQGENRHAVSLIGGVKNLLRPLLRAWATLSRVRTVTTGNHFAFTIKPMWAFLVLSVASLGSSQARPESELTVGPNAKGSLLRPASSDSSLPVLIPQEFRILLETVLPGRELSFDAVEIQYRKRTEAKWKRAGEKLVCRFEKKWSCPTIELGQSVLLRAKAGFLQLNGELHRDIIELRPQGEKLLVINHLPIDAYVAGVATAEMGPRFHDEALKAQIVAARSYAIATAMERRNQNEAFDLMRTQRDQVYKSAIDPNPRILRLTQATRGTVLLAGNQALKSFYHSSSGGYLEQPSRVWPGFGNSLVDFAFKSKADPFDVMAKKSQWSMQLSPSFGSLWPDLGEIQSIEVRSRTPGKRVARIEVIGSLGKKLMTGEEFRKAVGYSAIRSTLFDVIPIRNGSGTGEVSLWRIEGAGWGHGVGMSQHGAGEMAKQGKSADDILAFYYPRATVKTIVD